MTQTNLRKSAGLGVHTPRTRSAGVSLASCPTGCLTGNPKNIPLCGGRQTVCLPLCRRRPPAQCPRLRALRWLKRQWPRTQLQKDQIQKDQSTSKACLTASTCRRRARFRSKLPQEIPPFPTPPEVPRHPVKSVTDGPSV
eukprot:Rmarinus@m.9220